MSCAQGEPARGAAEAEVDEQRLERRTHDRLAVELLQPELRAAAGEDELGERAKRRVGGGEHERRRGRARLAGVGTQALDRAGQRELRTAEALDEVAAPADAEGLEVAERVVERGEAARDALGEDLLTGDD